MNAPIKTVVQHVYADLQPCDNFRDTAGNWWVITGVEWDRDGNWRIIQVRPQ